jgi:beta-phosphoglucomutase-like phosphatase (HAD superfamily)
MKEFCQKLLQRPSDERIDAKMALKIAKDIKDEREEYFKEEEEREKKNNKKMEYNDIEKAKNDVETFWGAYTNRMGL